MLVFAYDNSQTRWSATAFCLYFVYRRSERRRGRRRGRRRVERVGEEKRGEEKRR